MTYIISNKNGIIIQPITLQIRVPFQFLTNQRAIKCTHYSEPRDKDGLNGCCSFSVVCAAREQTLRLVHPAQRRTVEQISRLFHLYLYLFFKCRLCWIFFTQYGLYGRPSCVMAEKEKSTSESSSLLSNLRERLLEKSAKQSEGEGISVPNQEVNPNVKQLLREKKFYSPQSSRSHRNQRLIVMGP